MDYTVTFEAGRTTQIRSNCSVLKIDGDRYFFNSSDLLEIAYLVSALHLRNVDGRLTQGDKVFVWFAGHFWRDTERTPKALLAHLKAMCRGTKASWYACHGLEVNSFHAEFVGYLWTCPGCTSLETLAYLKTVAPLGAGE